MWARWAFFLRRYALPSLIGIDFIFFYVLKAWFIFTPRSMATRAACYPLRTWTSHDLDIWRYLMSYTLTSFHHLPSIHYTYRCHSWGGGWQPMTKTNRSTPARAGPVIVSQCAYCIPLLRVLLHPWWQTVLFTTRVERMSSLMCAQVVKRGTRKSKRGGFLGGFVLLKEQPFSPCQ